MSIQTVFGVVAGLLSFVPYPIYIRDILRGNTKPNRITWWVWALASFLLAASYYASGARDTIWIPVSYCIGFSAVAILSVKYGEGGWSFIDRLSIAGVFLSAFLWWIFQSPELGLFAVVFVDFFGFVPTLFKSYRRPWTENTLAWQIGTVASLLNICAIESWTFVVALYPLYALAANGTIASILTFSKKTEHDSAVS